MKPVMREAKVQGNEDWPKWMVMGSVTYSEAARRMALWCYNFSKKKSLPKTLRILVRDQDGPDWKGFEFDVEVRVDAKVTALRGED